MLLLLFIISPTIIGFSIFGLSILYGEPIDFHRISWLFVEAQLISLVIGVISILIKGKSNMSLSPWRLSANKWIGRIMATFVIIFLIGSILSAVYGP